MKFTQRYAAFIWCSIILLFATVSGFAQEVVEAVADGEMSGQQLTVVLINVAIAPLAPYLVSLFWKIYPSVPKAILPFLPTIIGTGIGAVASYFMTLAGQDGFNPFLSAAAGSFGLALRQGKKEINEKLKAQSTG